MTAETRVAAGRWGTWRAPSNLSLLVGVAVVGVLVLAGLLIWDGVRISESDLWSDRWFCSQPTTSAFDRGPNTGRLCGELLQDR